MKKILLALFAFLGVILILPLIIVELMGGSGNKTAKDDELISVYFADEDEVKEINAGEYLVGVVAAEMPAEFDEEALKAQAAAARTYMTYHSAKSKEHKGGAAVCTDHTHCQAWVDINDKMEAWGSDAKKYRKKIENAVSDTADELIKYNGEPINAVFFSTSSGHTENSADVWGEALPYLVSVESPGEENAPKFTSEASFTLDEAKSRLSGAFNITSFTEPLFSDIERTDSGAVKTVNVCGNTVKGTELRTAFDLNSANIEITEADDAVKFNVRGYGHGVGMSQYGANAMAKNGADYKEILTHYYTGAEVSK